MNRMVFWIAGFCLAASVGVPASAQLADLEKLGHTTAEQRAEFLTKDMKSRLSLTAEQLPKVEALNLEYAKKAQPLLEEQGDLFSRIRKMRAQNEEKEAALRKLLSDEQWKEYEAGRSDLKSKMEAWADSQAKSKSP